MLELAIDIGNSRVCLAAFDKSKLVAQVSYPASPADTDGLELCCNRFCKEQLLKYKQEKFEIISIASVVNQLTDIVAEFSSSFAKLTPHIINNNSRLNISGFIADRQSVGVDRIANAAAAIDTFDCPLIVVDLGTATTFSVIDNKKRYLGGAIAAGLTLSFNALIDQASGLSQVDLTPPGKSTGDNISIIGKTTGDNLRSGAITGTACMVDGMIVRLEAELGCKTTRIATGGNSNLINGPSRTIEFFQPALTLQGVNLIGRLNKWVP